MNGTAIGLARSMARAAADIATPVRLPLQDLAPLRRVDATGNFRETA